ncbi:unnamed protein product [Phytophthora fragariaefolia]|uniref:Unnamed protein product n=1 Tax=Phytophthora fragariaefolia TaxID=1490495 RepID=A0A9W6XDF4_9STRA|nr:unnamed protein product [Phytophthora fragariaefolia]
MGRLLLCLIWLADQRCQAFEQALDQLLISLSFRLNSTSASNDSAIIPVSLRRRISALVADSLFDPAAGDDTIPWSSPRMFGRRTRITVSLVRNVCRSFL